MSELKCIKLDANYQQGINKCEECSAHEDKDDPSVCLVCNGAKIDPKEYIYGYPSWCPLETMAIIDSEARQRKNCVMCKENRVKAIMDGERYKYSICRGCGTAYYANK